MSLTLSEMSLAEIDSMMTQLAPVEIATQIVRHKALHIRDVERGEPPYVYSSGNCGPGYIMIKGLVGHQRLWRLLVRQFALKVKGYRDFDFIAGLVTGGVPPSLLLREYLQTLQQREIGYVYIRGTRKQGGTNEQVIGILDLATNEPNWEVPPGSAGVVMEELVNYGRSLCNGATLLRALAYRCNRGFTLVEYDNPFAEKSLQGYRIRLHSLITLPTLLDAVEQAGVFERRLVESYRAFGQDPMRWMVDRGYSCQ
jgi:orotate phosphoribosyltransferase